MDWIFKILGDPFHTATITWKQHILADLLGITDTNMISRIFHSIAFL